MCRTHAHCPSVALMAALLLFTLFLVPPYALMFFFPHSFTGVPTFWLLGSAIPCVRAIGMSQMCLYQVWDSPEHFYGAPPHLPTAAGSLTATHKYSAVTPFSSTSLSPSSLNFCLYKTLSWEVIPVSQPVQSQGIVCISPCTLNC